jgi:hypothetical protein
MAEWTYSYSKGKYNVSHSETQYRFKRFFMQKPPKHNTPYAITLLAVISQFCSMFRDIRVRIELGVYTIDIWIAVYILVHV